jgi:hypothetical protein
MNLSRAFLFAVSLAFVGAVVPALAQWSNFSGLTAAQINATNLPPARGNADVSGALTPTMIWEATDSGYQAYWRAAGTGHSADQAYFTNPVAMYDAFQVTPVSSPVLNSFNGTGSTNGDCAVQSGNTHMTYDYIANEIVIMYRTAPQLYGANASASATASGSTVTVSITNGGSGYVAGTPPTVTIVGGGGSYTSATPTITSGSVSAITVAGASGYTSNPTVTITAPPSTATATATYVSPTSITFAINNGGSLYPNTAVHTPNIILTGGGGTYTPPLIVTTSGGQVTGITMNGASGWSSAPTVSIEAPFIWGTPNALNTLCVAVTDGNDPTAVGFGWNTYTYNLNTWIGSDTNSANEQSLNNNTCNATTPCPFYADWPQLGVWSDGYYVTLDAEDYNNPESRFNIVGSVMVVLDRAAMSTGSMSPRTPLHLAKGFQTASGTCTNPEPNTWLNNTPGYSYAMATAVETGGNTITVTVMPNGSGYNAVPTVTLYGGGGTYTSATATVVSGQVTAITVTGASGYTSNPTVAITGWTPTQSPCGFEEYYARHSWVPGDAGYGGVSSGAREMTVDTIASKSLQAAGHGTYQYFVWTSTWGTGVTEVNGVGTWPSGGLNTTPYVIGCWSGVDDEYHNQQTATPLCIPQPIAGMSFPELDSIGDRIMPRLSYQSGAATGNSVDTWAFALTWSAPGQPQNPPTTATIATFTTTPGATLNYTPQTAVDKTCPSTAAGLLCSAFMPTVVLDSGSSSSIAAPLYMWSESSCATSSAACNTGMSGTAIKPNVTPFDGTHTGGPYGGNYTNAFNNGGDTTFFTKYNDIMIDPSDGCHVVGIGVVFSSNETTSTPVWKTVIGTGESTSSYCP